MTVQQDVTSPTLSHPVLYSVAAVSQDKDLTGRLIEFINEAFQRSKDREPAKWDRNILRFPSEAELFEMLGEDGVFAVIFDQLEGPEQGKIVACAAAVRWKGLEREVGKDHSQPDGSEKTEIEEGWEIKVVCVSADPRYAKKGLAIRVCDFLQENLVKHVSEVADASERATKGHLILWIITAECMNGNYWRRRGFQDVMKRVTKPPIWGSKTEFVMLVLRKDVTWTT